MFYTCIYLDNSGTQQTVKLDIRQCATGTDEVLYYAWHAERLGCGNNAPTPEGACRILVNDHGRGFISCKKIPPVACYHVTVTRSDMYCSNVVEFPTAKLAAKAALLVVRMLADEPNTHALHDYMTGRKVSMCGWSNRDRTAHVEVRRTMMCR